MAHGRRRPRAVVRLRREDETAADAGILERRPAGNLTSVIGKQQSASSNRYSLLSNRQPEVPNQPSESGGDAAPGVLNRTVRGRQSAIREHQSAISHRQPPNQSPAISITCMDDFVSDSKKTIESTVCGLFRLSCRRRGARRYLRGTSYLEGCPRKNDGLTAGLGAPREGRG